MRNIRTTMPKMQLKSKSVNNMLPEWGRFITEVKLNRGLRESNFDQLYAYLKQHEVHANENKMMLERFTQTTNDPLALLDSGFASSDNLIESLTNTLALLTQSYKAYLPQTNNQLILLTQGTKLQFKMAELLFRMFVNGAALDEEQLLFLAGEHVTNFDNDVDEPLEQDLALNVDHIFEANQCDAFNSDVDEAPTTQTMFMANLTSKDPIYDETDHLMTQTFHMSDCNFIPYDQYVEDNAEQVVQSHVSSVQNDALMSIIDEMHKQGTGQDVELHSVQMQLCSTIDHNKSMAEEVKTLKKDFKQKEDKFLKEFLDIKKLEEKVKDRLFKQDQSVQMEIVKTHHAPPVVHDSKDTLEIAEITKKRMLEKMKSPLCVENKVKIAPPDYSKENYLVTFTPKRNLTSEQIFWSHDISKTVKTVPKPLLALTMYPTNTPAKLVPRVLPTKSQVKINLYTLTQHFMEFEKTCKKRITPTVLLKGKWVLDKQKGVTSQKSFHFSKHLNNILRESKRLFLKKLTK
ncbi:hypothetical protein Tco_0950281 [Tanacetum coccineum]